MRAKDLMNRKETILVLLITIAVVIVAVNYLSSNPGRLNASAVSTTGNLGIYWDKSCTNPVTSISWGTLTLGSKANVTIYVRNESNTTIIIFENTSNWNPANAQTYLEYSWTAISNRIDAWKTLQVIQVLKVLPSIIGISSFSFDITVKQLETPQWDVNQDHKVDAKDVYIVAEAYGSTPQIPGWNPQADINGDSTVNVKDVYLVAQHFGETYP